MQDEVTGARKEREEHGPRRSAAARRILMAVSRYRRPGQGPTATHGVEETADLSASTHVS